jgi:hypothetical protein
MLTPLQQQIRNPSSVYYTSIGTYEDTVKAVLIHFLIMAAAIVV